MALSRASARVPRLSVVITAYNEGEELGRTIESVRAHTEQPYEIIVVDGGSTDGSCVGIEADDVRVVRHDQRIGVAASRNDACAAARGEIFAFLDAHQRISPGCLDRCADIADAHQAIVWPDVRGLEDRGWTGHGARLSLCDKHGFFAGQWVRRAPRHSLSSISMMIVPGYVMPRAVYGRVRWIGGLRGWGASEPAIAVKAFFLDIPILHLCGPLARHWFRQELPYATPWEGVWRNHALVARVSFDDRSWFDYWLPHVFEPHLSEAVRGELQSPEVLAEREVFAAQKIRGDGEFFELVGRPEIAAKMFASSRPRAKASPQRDEDYLDQQRQRSQPGEYKSIRPRVDAALRWMTEHIPAAALLGKRGLDVGARDGYAVEVLRRLGLAEAGGIELVPETAEYAAGRGRAVRQGDMRRLSDPDASWDLVTCIHSLEHCPEPARAISEMGRVLRPGGWLLLVVPRELGQDSDPLHNWACPSAAALQELVLAHAEFDPATFRHGTGVLARGCRELRLLAQKRKEGCLGETLRGVSSTAP